ncbi:MAG: aspartate--tRNA(Asn) ligase [Candidatus Heimdallarchaeota archaeon]|nr:MAG: aspartate--tRNA(Asn) ligase [Candidatus Heimdallarchaeota archaeon]
MMIYAVNPEMRTHSCRDVNSNNDGIKVLIGGWVQQIRDKGRLIFLTIRDTQGICQVTLHKNKTEPQVWETCKGLSLESVVSIKGTVKADPRSKLSAELIPSMIHTHSLAAPKFPIDLTKMKTQMDIDTVFKYRELSIRDPEIIAVMELKNLIAASTRVFFLRKGFIEIFTPLILTASTEGGAEMFSVDYFGHPAVLAQSCQFYKQAALACHEKIFGIIPSWRAEKSHTPKHINEFYQIENEIAFATDEEIMQVQEDLVISVLKQVTKDGATQLELLNRKITLPSKPFKRLPFAEAKSLVHELGVETEPQEDFGAPEETALSKAFQEPFFITEFPTHLRGMYYATDPQKPGITHSLDLMAPEGFGELSSGGQRVSDYKILKNRIIKQGYDLDNFNWYLRMFKYGMPPHAGFGLGFERLIRWIANLDHIREACMFPRTPEIFQP